MNNYLSKVFDLFYNTTSLLLFAIISGSLVGLTFSQSIITSGRFIDPTILVLVSLLLFEVPVQGIFKGFKNIKFLCIAWVLNFIFIPFIGFMVASLFLSGNALFYTGLVIYFMSPCTDWFLGFTRLAKGNVELGAALLPINMLSQLILFPVYLLLFDTIVAYKVNLSSLVEWFLQPLLVAVMLRIILHKVMSRVLPMIKFAIPLVLTLLVFQIFTNNVYHLVNHLNILPVLFATISLFFVLTYLLGEGSAKIANLKYADHCLLTFTTAARNAPLMLGLTTIALPEQPLIYATITIGMLIEFPHLAGLKAIMLRRLKTEKLTPEQRHLRST